MVSHWHSGTPVRSARLVWPSEDAVAQREFFCGLTGMSSLTSIMDGLVLYWLPFSSDTRRTLIYMADTRKPIEREGMSEVVISKVTELPYFAHCAVLLEKRSGFVTAEWVIGEKVLNLRRHALDGSLVKQKIVPTLAVWGELRAFGQKVAICASSGPTNFDAIYQYANPLSDGNGEYPDIRDLTADQIIEWDADTESLRRITIPNNPQHGAEFHFFTEHRVALACVHDDPQGPLLMCIMDQSEEEKSFSPGGTSLEFQIIGRSVGEPGSSEFSNILVHSFDRIAVFDKSVLTADIPDHPRDGRLHYIGRLLLDYNIRVLPFCLPGSLPAIDGNRVLVCQSIASGYVFYVLDFDQDHVGAFLDTTPQEREDLTNELREAGARVKIVTRRFYALEAGVQMGRDTRDAEYPRRAGSRWYGESTAPPEWQDHLRELEEKEKQNPPLLFDEAPSERGRPFGFVQSFLKLGKVISTFDVQRMAITSGAVLFAPEPGCDNGMVWYFD
ncbi:hypothetical protein D9758_008479 [Tetrapyrgos nigripes]|uniref:Uncharacterized protein n=1 Tax=Tetrapyrgos nigripes TaxID=182062 RepID=A0A8H5CP08_9AGAR|nr:hypothetical protein D9758_008479 [Tetrapyrgos nigripes]